MLLASRLSLLTLAAACSGSPTAVTDTSPDPPPTGTLLITQIDMRSSWIGEAALVIGPDGTTVMIDVGNAQHTDEVRAVLDARGLAALDHVLLTHNDNDHVGGFAGLFEGGDSIPINGQVFRQDDTPLPTTLPLGDGAELTLFLAAGMLATDAGVVDLTDEVDLGDEDNPRSLGGVITYGDFEYVFAGDLTGGGKDTADVESAVAARAADIPWVPQTGVDAVHVSHHGISSSTNAAWTAWLQPQLAVVGANNTYLDAPSEEALESLAPYVEAVWVTEDGLLGNEDERTTIAHDSVTIEVDGDAVSIRAGL